MEQIYSFEIDATSCNNKTAIYIFGKKNILFIMQVVMYMNNNKHKKLQ